MQEPSSIHLHYDTSTNSNLVGNQILSGISSKQSTPIENGDLSGDMNNSERRYTNANTNSLVVNYQQMYSNFNEANQFSDSQSTNSTLKTNLTRSNAFGTTAVVENQQPFTSGNDHKSTLNSELIHQSKNVALTNVSLNGVTSPPNCAFTSVSSLDHSSIISTVNVNNTLGSSSTSNKISPSSVMSPLPGIQSAGSNYAQTNNMTQSGLENNSIALSSSHNNEQRTFPSQSNPLLGPTVQAPLENNLVQPPVPINDLLQSNSNLTSNNNSFVQPSLSKPREISAATEQHLWNNSFIQPPPIQPSVTQSPSTTFCPMNSSLPVQASVPHNLIIQPPVPSSNQQTSSYSMFTSPRQSNNHSIQSTSHLKNSSVIPTNSLMQTPFPIGNHSQPTMSANPMQPPIISNFVKPSPLANNTTQSPLSRPPISGNSIVQSNNTLQPLVAPIPNTQVSTATPLQQYPRKYPNAFMQSQQIMSSNIRPPSSQFQLPPNPSSQTYYNNQPTPSNNFQTPTNKAYNNYQVPPSIQNNISQGNSSHSSQQNFQQGLNSQFSNLSVNQGINKMWGYEPHDLLNLRNVLPPSKLDPPPIRLPQGLHESMNCSPDLFRCTLTKIPESKSLLEKSRLPLGLLIHPFKDINQLKVIKNVIVRCKTCRTYINPFVQFLDSKLWKCNMCFRTNEIHEQFLYDRNTEMYGDPYRRPEVQSATVEYLATADYNVRDPPQPAMYLFLLDVSQIAAQSRYLYTVCEVLLNKLKSMPGDLRTSIGIITYDSSVHFYSLSEGQAQPSQMILTDIDDIFLPSPENILVNLNECYDMVVELLKQLPDKFKHSLDSGCALGAALQAAYQLLKRTGGRVTVFQTCLPNKGPGALQSRENPNQRSNDEPQHMNPSTDFYKKMALDCSLSQIGVDLFIVNSQYVDLATLSGISKFSSGCIHHIPLYSGKNMSHVYQLDRMFSRYLTRKIGFESVMRIRCTRGLAIHTFHGNFFVRSPDLLALPNVNPDAGFGIQISIDENLTHVQYACFQAALLYTSSKGDRRIRVHTVCLPVVSNVNDVLVGADVQCMVGLLAKMAVDRSLQHSLSDAREAFLNVICDVLSTYKLTQTGHLTGSLLAPSSLKLLPLYVLALLKHPSFRIGQSTRLDDRIFAMSEMKCLPLSSLILSIYPELYPIHNLDQTETFDWNQLKVPSPEILQLSAERLQATGTYLLNTSDTIIILVRHGTAAHVCSQLFGFQQVSLMPETTFELPLLETSLSERLHSFITYLNDDKAYGSPVKIIKDSSPDRIEFYDRLIEDKNGAGMSYYEFLQRVREQVK